MKKEIEMLKKDFAIISFKDNDFIKYCILFFSLFISTSMIYIILIANQLVNTHDGIWNGNDYMIGDWGISLGRWLYVLYDISKSGIQCEPINSLLSIVILTINVLLIFGIFDIKLNKKMYCFMYYIVGMIFMTSSTVLIYLSYRYMSPVFALSMLLAVCSIFLYLKFQSKILKYVIPIIFILFSCALYQAQITFAVVIMLVYAMHMLCNNADIKQIIKVVFLYIVIFLIGCVLYRISWVISSLICGIAPSSYKGADQVSIISIIISIPRIAILLYKDFVLYYFKNGIVKHDAFFNSIFYLCVFAMIFFVYLLKVVVNGKSNKFGRVFFGLFLVIILPLSLNVTYFFAPYAYVSEQQTIGYAGFLFLLLLLILNFWTENSLNKGLFFILIVFSLARAFFLCDLDLLISNTLRKK